jgi:hemerythrin
MSNTFCDALLQAHRYLLKDLQALRSATETTAAERPADLATHLERARADIREHFQFEERNGYMASVLQAQPQLERTVQHLQEEHGQLLRSVNEIITEVGRAPTVTEELRQKVRDWLRSVQQHERSENVLVQDAFNVDIEAED